MANQKLPVEILEARGKKHLSQAEIDERRATEVKAPRPKTVKVPDWLPANLAKDYRAIARQLIALDIFSDLDAALLGRYLIAQASWLQASEYVDRTLSHGDPDTLDKWTRIQDRFFKQATACARELGLSVTSRCKLVIPQVQEAEPDENADLFA